jgi:hypothetical protein
MYVLIAIKIFIVFKIANEDLMFKLINRLIHMNNELCRNLN